LWVSLDAQAIVVKNFIIYGFLVVGLGFGFRGTGLGFG